LLTDRWSSLLGVGNDFAEEIQPSPMRLFSAERDDQARALLQALSKVDFETVVDSKPSFQQPIVIAQEKSPRHESLIDAQKHDKDTYVNGSVKIVEDESFNVELVPDHQSKDGIFMEVDGLSVYVPFSKDGDLAKRKEPYARGEVLVEVLIRLENGPEGLGILLEEEEEEVQVRSVKTLHAASRGGVRKGDIVVEVNGVQVSSISQVKELLRHHDVELKLHRRLPSILLVLLGPGLEWSSENSSFMAEDLVQALCNPTPSITEVELVILIQAFQDVISKIRRNECQFDLQRAIEESINKVCTLEDASDDLPEKASYVIHRALAYLEKSEQKQDEDAEDEPEDFQLREVLKEILK